MATGLYHWAPSERDADGYIVDRVATGCGKTVAAWRTSIGAAVLFRTARGAQMPEGMRQCPKCMEATR